jgi:hypothetical protein
MKRLWSSQINILPTIEKWTNWSTFNENWSSPSPDILRIFRASILDSFVKMNLGLFKFQTHGIMKFKARDRQRKGRKRDSFNRESLLRFPTIESKKKNLKVFCYRYGPLIP